MWQGNASKVELLASPITEPPEPLTRRSSQSIAVQIDAEEEGEAGQPVQQDPDYPVTPPPKKRGRPKKTAMRGHTIAKTLHILGFGGILAPIPLASGGFGDGRVVRDHMHHP